MLVEQAPVTGDRLKVFLEIFSSSHSHNQNFTHNSVSSSAESRYGTLPLVGRAPGMTLTVELKPEPRL